MVYPPPEEQGFAIFGLTLMKMKTFAAYVMRVRSAEYHRGYNSGYTDGVKAGHSHEWHDGYNQGARQQNGLDILHRTVSFDGKVTTVLGMLDTLRTYARLVEAKDEQIELLYNRIASLVNIIEMLDSDDESGDSE
jgi:hypothetical protein